MFTTERGIITTFYSYKGGTGRSMALANVACLVAKESRGRVLLIDWDLEAPGLHNYFHDFLPKDYEQKKGLIEFFQDANDSLPEMKLDEEDPEKLQAFFKTIYDYLLKIKELPNGFGQSDIWILKAGRFDETYSNRIGQFDWQAFFQKIPQFFLHFAKYLSEQFTHVFVDSRTGHTDTGGICTMLMPEKLVLVFTPNHQSLDGVLKLAHKAVQYRRNSDDYRPLMIYPVPSRVELGEDSLRKKWQSEYTEEFEEIFHEVYGLSDDVSLEDYFHKVQIQQMPRFAYGEEVSVLRESVEDVKSLSFSYELLKERMFEASEIWGEKNGNGNGTYSKRTTERRSVLVLFHNRDIVLVNKLSFYLSAFVKAKLIFQPQYKELRNDRKNEISDIRDKDYDAILVFLNSEFIADEVTWDDEFEQFFKKHELRRTQSIAILSSPCIWDIHPVFSKLPKLPLNGKPLSTFKDLDEGIEEIGIYLKGKFN